MKINTFVIPIIRSDYIERMLFTLYRYTQADRFNVIVIDQTQDDEAQKKCQKYAHLWIKSYRNLGFAKAMNTGIRLADTKYITLANDDIEFIDSRWFQGIIDTFAQDSKIIAVNPMSPKEASWGYGLSNDNKEIWQPPQGFYPIDDKSGIVPIVNGKPFIYQEQFSEEEYNSLLENHPTWSKGSCCDAIAMWCTVFKKTGLEEIGLLDEKFFPGGGEDYDMNARAYSCAYPKPIDECDVDFHRRMVGTSKSWVWHHWSKSRNMTLDNKESKYLNSRPRWNNNDELWPNGFDCWGHSHKVINDKDVKIPLQRVPFVFTDEL